MKKHIKVLGFGILSMLVFGTMLMPIKANAQDTPYSSYGSTYVNTSVPIYNPAPVYIPTPTTVYVPVPTTRTVYVPTQTTRTVYVTTPPVTRTVYVPTPVASPAPATPVVYANSSINQNTNPTYNDNGQLDNTQAANVISATNSFMPSGAIQWIFFAILVLIVVLLARRIFSSDKKYIYTTVPIPHS